MLAVKRNLTTQCSHLSLILMKQASVNEERIMLRQHHLSIVVLFMMITLGSSQQLNTYKGINVELSSNSNFKSGIHYLENVTDLPRYLCMANITSIQNLQMVSYVGYKYNKEESICDLLILSGGRNGSSSCPIQVEFDNSQNTELRWNISEISRVAGEHQVTCVVGVITQPEFSNSSAAILRLQATQSVSFYQVPDAININIFPPPTENFMFQDEIYYNFTCRAVGGYPPSRLQNRIMQGAQVLAEDVREQSYSDIRFQIRISSHRGVYIRCKDLTHGEKSKHLTTNTGQIKNFAYIRRTSKKAKTVTVYKDKGEATIGCSDYVSWSGTVQFLWFGRYGIARRKFLDSTKRSYTVK